LSFALGLPLDALRDMSADDLALYQKFTAKRGFPGRRIELLLAQVSQLIAQTMGGAKNTKLSDFLFDPAPAIDDATSMTVEEIRSLHGFKPRKRKQNGK
jgi:hypothetical protein